MKINTPADREQLAAQADLALQELAASASQIWIDRETATRLFDYATWPPELAGLKSLTAASRADYVATGSLTRLGDAVSIDLVVMDLLQQRGPTYFYGKASSVQTVPEVLERLGQEVLAFTQREFRLAEIKVEGNQRIDAGAILRHIKSKASEPYNPAQLRDDLQSVFQMGYFEDAQIEVENTAQGKVVVFRVKEKPVISRIEISGEKEVKADDIQEVITIKTGSIINSNEVKESVDRIRKLYKEKGFYNTEVNANLSYPRPDRVDARFVIDEGEKVYIREVEITGNHAFSDKEIKKVISTSEKGFFSWLTDSGVLKQEMVEQDAARIASFYNNYGYIDAKVGKPEIRQEGKWLYVTFPISEGERYKVGQISLTGDLIAEPNELLELVHLTEGEYFSRQTLREDILRLTDYYADHGYAFAEAVPLIDKTGDQQVDVTIELHQGPLVHINRIIIRGNTRTRDKVVRREMAVEESGVFNASALKRSNERLQRLGYFEEVNITPEPTASEDLMDILVEVKEKPTGNFSIGAGYSSVDNLLFMAEISQDNWLGKGQRLSLQANLSGNSTRYNFSFTDPHYNDSQLLAGFDFYDWQREYDDYTRDSYGGALRFGYPIWELWKLYWSYGYDNTTLEDVRATASRFIRDSQNINVTSFFRVGLERDTRNRLYDPSRGSVHSLGTKYAGGPLGGDAQFTKLEASTSWYYPLFWDTVFHFRLAGGHVIENDDDKLPVFEKFFLGGLNSVRGFDYGEISPRDPLTNEKIGGETMWYTNVEYIFPLVKDAGLKGLVFFDAGDVASDSVPDSVYDRVRMSTGFGFRWLSPMGPLRLEWGYNLDPVADEEQSSWDFSIGGTF